MIQIVTADGVRENALMDDLRVRSAAVGEEITRSAAAIMEDVRQNGYEAVERYSLQFDHAVPREFTPEELERAYEAGCRHFICGMARGADLYFAEAVLALRECRPGVTLECARPCESQAHSWPKKEQERYQSILDQCDYETLVQHRYDRFCMMRRNRYMVDHAAHILTVYNGVPQGGTAQTLLYAIRKGVLVHPVPLEEET